MCQDKTPAPIAQAKEFVVLRLIPKAVVLAKDDRWSPRHDPRLRPTELQLKNNLTVNTDLTATPIVWKP